jgi:hypothetical protein
MHIDLTPAVLLAGADPRTSVIFHSKPEHRTAGKRRLLANPWGFGEWFKENTQLEADFAKMFAERAMAHDRAPAEPVPDQEPAYLKSRALIALQLMKRWRNVLFTRPGRANLRRPPSIVLAKHIADHANRPRRFPPKLNTRLAVSCTASKPKKAQGGSSTRSIHAAPRT